MQAIALEGCTDTVKESAPKVDSGRKIPCRTEESSLPRRRAGPTLYQLSYIPTQLYHMTLCTGYLGEGISLDNQLGSEQRGCRI